MNRIRVAALINSGANPFQQKVSYIHSTPILERKRRTHWDSGGGYSRGSSRSHREPRFSSYSRRNRKLHSKQDLLHNVSSFAEHLFQSWKFDDFDDNDNPFASRNSSWFRQDFNGNRSKKGNSRNKGQQAWNTRFQFFVDDDDFDVETIFKSALGGNKYTYYSFIDEEPQWRGSFGRSNNHRHYWNWGRQDEEEDSSSSDSLESDLTSDRLALGLSSSGPLSLTDVKNAYRVCALKWHPDRHHGPHKAAAEEKFKLCGAAYQSLCDKLGLN
ncbi:uncharacterized protein LOC113775132 isoform X1 [Coffea eugenioides]|uniref:uncharacterized protein LOC113775132 isoform X1 n=1 Tax=Coffea eugenioides TaxID=49369 RepID=UPI000F604604|nr:uncharacterized protein LOC113775132 isoform X1 [Coffea eugenioides]